MSGMMELMNPKLAVNDGTYEFKSIENEFIDLDRI